MPADIVAEGKLSNLQLEAIVYGCQRHLTDLPSAPAANTSAVAKENMIPKAEVKPNMNEDQPNADLPQDHIHPKIRAGFLLGDGAGMGKGRTLAGFVVENIARGRKKHVWISVSSNLYEDAKRDLTDLGLGDYAEKQLMNRKQLIGMTKQQLTIIRCTYKQPSWEMNDVSWMQFIIGSVGNT